MHSQSMCIGIYVYVFYLHVCMYTTCMQCQGNRKRLSSSRKLELQNVVSSPAWWDLNLSLLQEQYLLLTTETGLQSQDVFYNCLEYHRVKDLNLPNVATL